MTDRPDGLAPEWAAAWDALAGGASYTEAGRAAADAVGRAKPFAAGTVCLIAVTVGTIVDGVHLAFPGAVLAGIGATARYVDLRWTEWKAHAS